MGTHTPGPWELGPQIIACVEGIETTFVSVEQPGFVTGGGLALVHIKHSESNARLIAAAPDSYAANVAMVDALNVAFHIKPEWDDERIYDELPTSGVASAYFAARAAIALATGGHR